MGAEVDDLLERLRSVSDDLADLAIERLRAAVDSDDGAPVAEERRLTRARRAVEKAIAVLGEGERA